VAPDQMVTLPREVRDFEPAAAVIAPGYAESVHSRLMHEAPRALVPEGWLVLELAAGQAPRVVELLDQTRRYSAVQTRKDGLGWERVVAARLRPATSSEARP
jgi:release factor glutamine methyltransferase